MNLGRLLRGALILPVAFGLAAQTGFASTPAKPRDCCASSCPLDRPSKNVPDCCLIRAVPDQTAVAAPAPDAPVLYALLPAPAARPAGVGIQAVVPSEARPPASRDRGAFSGLSPPRPA